MRKISLTAWLKAEKNQVAVRSCGLAGCPVGGWAETEQAMRRIRDELPMKCDRSFTVRDVVDALYCEDHNCRYALID
jgi:hypothetical protein